MIKINLREESDLLSKKLTEMLGKYPPICDPCPFCGATARLSVEEFDDCYHVTCSCGAIGPEAYSEGQALLVWDMRRLPIREVPNE